jgi:hypothetical protein
VWVYVSFIDIDELDRRAYNGGDYKLGSVVRSVYSSSCERVFLVRLGSHFIDDWEGAAYLLFCLS